MSEIAMQTVTDELLRAWPLPMPDEGGGKEERGRVLIIGGSREIPGAVILAGQAALRAGAGKLAIATGESVAQLVAASMPEARVIGLPETRGGGLAIEAVELVREVAERADAVLIGPGMEDEKSNCGFVLALLPHLAKASVILDASAMGVVCDTDALQEALDLQQTKPEGRAHFLMTPHAGEMAHLTGLSKDALEADPGTSAREAARSWNAVIAFKGRITHIASPDQRMWRHAGGNVGLGTSGSGDVLAGLICGLAARGASLEQACVWGVALHGMAGDKLAEKMGTLGYLARELAPEVPALMNALGETGGASGKSRTAGGPSVMDAAAA